MKSLNKTLFFFILIITSCSVGKQGVYYVEMNKNPIITAKDNILTIKTGNSIKNTALLIYKIDYKIDTIKKEIELKAFQALGKKYQDSFDIEIKEKVNLSEYKFYWINPDDTKVELEINID